MQTFPFDLTRGEARQIKKGRLKARVRMRPVDQVALPNLGLDSASENDNLASQESNIYIPI